MELLVGVKSVELERLAIGLWGLWRPRCNVLFEGQGKTTVI